ncbi:MAG TPA: hypothetical protein VJ885_04740 [Thermoanaerobaculia bacterium]|nr:hypothetical protein [Thermoanaerobaculia bacterium]
MKRFGTPLLLLLLVLSTTGSLTRPAAALVPVDEPFDIGTVFPMDTSHVAAARLDGTYLVVASHAGRIFGRFVGPGGALVGEEFTIDQGAGIGSPAVAFRPDGGFIVVYVRQAEIRAAVYDQNGERLRYVIVGPQRLPDRRNLEPSVAIAADGTWMTTWRETGPTFPDEGTLYGRWYAPDSTPKTEPMILENLAFFPERPEVTAAPDGGFFVLWSEASGDNVTPIHPYTLHGRRFDGAGTPLHETEHLSYGSRGHLFPRPQGDGYVLVASGLWFRPQIVRLDLDGQQVGSAVDSGFPTPGESAEAAVDPEGRLLVAALGFDEVTSARLYDLSTLQPLSNIFTIPSSGGLRLFKSPASAWPGQFLALWYGLDFPTIPLPGPLDAQIFTLGCGADADTLCLRDGRFRVEVSWRDHQGNTGTGHPVALGDDTGTFWFFTSSNAELFIKILDGRNINDRFWVFYGSLSDVEYTIRVEDTVTGQVRTYQNPSGNMASHADVNAFPGTASAAGPLLSRSARPATQPLIDPLIGPIVCAYGADALCLLGMEYQVTVDFIDPFTGQTRTARGFPFSQESGAFWFFDQGNIELFVKVLDGSAVNGHAWVFHAALTDVEYTLRVLHVPSRTGWEYHNPRGRMHSGADTSALPPPTGD